MKFSGWIVSAGLAAGGMTAAVAQPLPSYPIRVSPYETVSDVGGPYAAMPPEARPPRYMPDDGYYAPPVITPTDVYAVLRDNGFSPLGIPRQRGLVYTIAAINPDGDDGRLVIDARSGRIIRFVAAWRLGHVMPDDEVVSYGPPPALPPLIDGRRPPRPPLSVPRLASRSPAAPLPRSAPPRAAGEPRANVKPEVKTAAPQAQPSQAVASQARPAAPITAPAPVEAKPAPVIAPTQPMPPAQGLD